MRCPAPHLSSCFLKGWTLLGLRMPCAGSGELGGYGPPPWQCPPAPLLLFAVASWSGVGARPSRTRRPTVQEAGLRAGWGVWAGHMRARSPRCSGLCAWALPASSHWDLRESSFHSGETEAGELVVVGRARPRPWCLSALTTVVTTPFNPHLRPMAEPWKGEPRFGDSEDGSSVRVTTLPRTGGLRVTCASGLIPREQLGPSPLPRMSRVGKQGVLGSCARVSMGSSVVELCHRRVWSAGPVCTRCREEPEPVQGSEPQAGEVGADGEPTQSSCPMCPRGAFRLQEPRFCWPGSPCQPSLFPSLSPSICQSRVFSHFL